MNRQREHLLILPEDSANHDIAIGFKQHCNLDANKIQILPESGGWKKVIGKFTESYISTLEKFPKCRIALIIDFDKDTGRLDLVKGKIPIHLIDRVFVLGVWSNPEELKRQTDKKFERIGEELADDCSQNTNKLWGHTLLRHNRGELERMIDSIKPFLFNLT